MADDFERAILFSFDQSGSVDAGLRGQAQSYLQSIKQSPECWQLCLSHFGSSGYVEVRFWCLQALHECVRGRYGELDPPARSALKAALLSAGTRPTGGQQAAGGGSQAAQLPSFLRNKIAQTVVAIAAQEYPARWPSFFQDLLCTLGSGPTAVDLFCRSGRAAFLV